MIQPKLSLNSYPQRAQKHIQVFTNFIALNHANIPQNDNNKLKIFSQFVQLHQIHRCFTSSWNFNKWRRGRRSCHIKPNFPQPLSGWLAKVIKFNLEKFPDALLKKKEWDSTKIKMRLIMSTQIMKAHHKARTILLWSLFRKSLQ